jgi:Mn-dependent DtxR family transcriptional regulator
MLSNLSPREHETLVKLGAKGPTASLDHIALNQLFTLGLVDVDSDRRIVLTETGNRLCEQLLRNGVKFSDDSVSDMPVSGE